VYPTSISSGTGKDYVFTCTLGIKTTSTHHSLLHELFTHMFQNPTTEILHMQFTLSGISTIIGIKNYQKLIVDNNQYYDSLVLWHRPS